MQPRPSPAKRISDRVNDRIVASVLGVEGLPLASDAAVAHAAAEELQRSRGAGNIPCIVREVVNGAARAAQFTHMAPEDAARATIVGVLRGARLAGLELALVIALTSERLVWSSSALGEKLSPCVRGAVAGAIEGSPPRSYERQTLLELVAAKTLAAVKEIDEAQLAEVRREIAAFVN